jgi:hypothetical protein
VSQLSGGAVDAEFACKLVDRMPLATTAPTCSNCNHAITHDALAPNSFFVSKKMCGTVSPEGEVTVCMGDVSVTSPRTAGEVGRGSGREGDFLMLV